MSKVYARPPEANLRRWEDELQAQQDADESTESHISEARTVAEDALHSVFVVFNDDDAKAFDLAHGIYNTISDFFAEQPDMNTEGWDDLDDLKHDAPHPNLKRTLEYIAKWRADVAAERKARLASDAEAVV